MNYLRDIKYYTKNFKSTSCIAEISAFEPYGRTHKLQEKESDHVAEYHVMLHVDSSAGSFSEQLSALLLSLHELLFQPPFNNSTLVFKRFFVSDIANQQETLDEQLSKFVTCDKSFTTGATSIIQQPPLDSSAVALWLYFQSRTEPNSEAVLNSEAVPRGSHNAPGSDFIFSRNGYTHLWSANKQISLGGISEQSEKLLCNYNKMLRENRCSLLDNTVRTWFFVQNIDTNYAAFAAARKNYFFQNGLTDKTHYIASTGIEGSNASAESFVTMDAYSLQGSDSEQIKFLYARSHLSPTSDYGVTFERGVAVKYGDRQQIFISGTASIDHSGNVLHSGNIKSQTFRMWENIEALLNESEAKRDDIAQIIVYLRNKEDYPAVRALFNEHFSRVPTVITLAAVCRSAWLIEMECIAINNKGDVRFRNL